METRSNAEGEREYEGIQKAISLEREMVNRVMVNVGACCRERTFLGFGRSDANRL